MNDYYILLIYIDIVSVSDGRNSPIYRSIINRIWVKVLIIQIIPFQSDTLPVLYTVHYNIFVILVYIW